MRKVSKKSSKGVKMGIKKVVIARALGVAPNTVYRWASQGVLEEKLKQYKEAVEIMKEYELIRELKEMQKQKKTGGGS